MGGRHAARPERPSRHAAAGSRGRRPVLLVAIGLVALVVGGGGWVVASKPGLVVAATAAASPSPSASPTRSSTAPPGKVINCREKVRAGDRLVKAAKKSYEDWYDHIHAQLDLDAGKITLDEANAIWDRTHKRGSKDMARFDTNKIVYENQGNPCAKVSKDVPARFTDEVRDCKKRLAAIDKTVAAGAKVSADWSKHTLQERKKETTDPYTYHKLWMDLVHEAPAHLKKFRKQYAKYQKAPACFPTKDK